MKLSVALCTWNGERYLEEQLRSILAQTRPADELIVCDDQSSDATAEIVARFASQAPFAVHFERNEQRLGPTQNFAKAIGRCRGDIIFLCDQDDFWLPEKLGRMYEVFAQAPEVGLVFSNGYIVDQGRVRLGYTLWDVLRLSEKHVAKIRAGELFDLLIQRNVVTGAAAAFRASFKDAVLPIPQDAMLHDAWIALLISGAAGCMALNEPLFEYRQHTHQQTGAHFTSTASKLTELQERKTKMQRQMEDAAKSYEAVRRHALERELWQEGDPHDSGLAAKRDHLTRRALLRENRLLKPLRLIAGLVRGNYFRYDRGWRSLAEDILT